MLFLGVFGPPYFVFGVVLYLCGTLAVLRSDSEKQIRASSLAAILLLLANLVFYSTVKLAPLVDVSFAIYGLLLADLIFCVWIFYKNGLIKKLNLPYLKFMIAYLAVISLSGAGAAHRKEVVYFFILNLGAYLVFFAVANILRGDSSGIKTVMKATVVLGSVSAALAVWQLYSESFKNFFFNFISPRDREIMQSWEYVSRVVGSWQHPSYLGTFLALSLSFCAYLLFKKGRNPWQYVFWSACFVFIGAVLLLTNTRSSVLAGILAVACVFGYILVTTDPSLHRKKTLQFFWIGMLGAGALLLYQFVFVGEIYSKPQAWRVDASATIWGRFLRADSMSSDSLVQRNDLYKLAWQTYKANPALGIGAKNFQFEVEKVYGKPTDAHNIFFQTAAETGSLGLLVSFVFGLFAAVDLARLWLKLSQKQRFIAAACYVCVPLILVDSLFNNPLYSLRLAAVFWLIIALIHAISEEGDYA